MLDRIRAFSNGDGIRVNFPERNRRTDSSIRKETADPVVRSPIIRRYHRVPPPIMDEWGGGRRWNAANFRYVRPEMGIERSASMSLSATATERCYRGEGGIGYPRFASHG